MEFYLTIVFWVAVVVLAYIYVGYALLMRLVTLISVPSRSAPLPDEKLPSVSLIIPAHDEESVIRAKLENALAQDYPAEKLEIVVASDGSTDNTVPIAEEFVDRGVKVLAFPVRRGKPQTVNDAVARTDGGVLCLCDANVMFERNALRRLVERLEDPLVGAVSADVRLDSKQCDFGDGERTYYRIERLIQLGESQWGSMIGVDGGMYVVRRELYQPILPNTVVDDFVISMQVIRRGKRVVYEPSAIAFENGTPGARAEFQRRVRVAAGAMQVLKRRAWPPLTRPIAFWQFMSHKLGRWSGSLWLAALLISNGLLLNSGLVYQVVFGVQILFYLLALTATVSKTVRRTRFGSVAFYFTMSHVATVLGLIKGGFNLQDAAWDRTDRSVSGIGMEAIKR